MNLIDEFEDFGSLDVNRRHWDTYGKTKKNQVVSLGNPARISIGERLTRKYVRFYQVHTGWSREQSTIEAISSVGEMKFHVTLEVTFRIDKTKAVDAVLDGIDLEETLLRPLGLAIRKYAKQYRPEDYKRFESEAESQIKSEAAGIARSGPFEINTIEVLVKRDENVADRDEIQMIVDTVRARLVKETHDGNTAKVAALTDTLNIMRTLQSDKHGETIDVAERAKDLQRAINDLVDLGLSDDDATIRTLRNQQVTLVRQAESNYSNQFDGDDAQLEQPSEDTGSTEDRD